MGHGTVADEIKGRTPNGPSRQGRVLAIEEEGVRYRSYLDGSARFLGPETSMAIQANLGSDLALVFDECTPFHADRDYTARSTERTHRWLRRCLDWHAAHGPDHQLVYGIVQGGVHEDLRVASAGEVAASEVDGVAIGGSLGADKAQMHEVVGWTTAALGGDAEAKPRHLLGIGEVDDLVRGDRARDRHLRLRDADAPGPSRDGARARPGRPVARRPGQGALAPQRRAAHGRLPVRGVRAGLHPRLPPLPRPGPRDDRDAPAHAPQPRLRRAPGATAARRDRHGDAGRRVAARCSRARRSRPPGRRGRR